MSKNMQGADVHSVIGTLLEAAIRDQKAIHEAVEGLNSAENSVATAAARLPGAVAREVDVSLKQAVGGAADTLVKRFDDANIEAERAAAAYRDAAAFSLRRIVIPVLSITAIGASAIVIAAWLAMPNLAELQARREERDQLEQRIAWLEKYGARSDITNCEISKDRKKTRLCVKLDPNFGDHWSGYLVVANK